MFDAGVRSNIRALYGIIRTETRAYAVAIVAVIAASAVYIVIPLVLREIAGLFTNLRGAFSSGAVWRIAEFAVVLIAFQSLAGFVYAATLATAGERIANALKRRFYRRAITLPSIVLSRTRLGEIASRFSSDIALIQDGITDGLTALLQHGLFAIGALIAVFVLNWRLTLVAMVGLLVVAALTSFGMTLATRTTMRIQEFRGSALSVLVESVVNAPVIKAFVRERYMSARFDDIVRTTYDEVRRRVLITAALTPITTFVFVVVLGAIVFIGLRFIMDGSFTVPGLVAYLTYSAMLAGSATQVGFQTGRIGQALAVYALYREFVEGTAELDESTVPTIDIPRGIVTLSSVGFRYPDASQASLDNVSFTADAGQTIAIVGPSGAGKSTLANLLVCALEPTSGEIAIDGIPICSVDPRAVREHIGYVPQEPFIFAGTLRENVQFGALDATEEAFAAAVVAANVEEFVHELPNGWDTLVGERGATLSRGQCQRIAIARVLLKNPKIVVLDEASASLDIANESLIREAIEHVLVGRTTFVIAHRGSIVRRVDRVAVLEGGRLTAFGAPGEVASDMSVYGKLMGDTLRSLISSEAT